MGIRGWVIRLSGVSMLALVLALTISGLRATPVLATSSSTTTLTVHYRICEEVLDDSQYFDACHDDPIVDGYLEIYQGNTLATYGNTDGEGNITFALAPGSYSIIGAPGDFLDDSYIYCSDQDGNTVPYDGVLTLGDDAQVTCDYYIVPTDARGGDALVTATVYNCPVGMTAETLYGHDCTLATDGFDITVVSLTGLGRPQTIADAGFDGTAYSWIVGPAATSDFEGVNYGIKESVLPAGYANYVIFGDAVESYDGNVVGLRITEDAPDASVTIFNFAPAPDDDEDEDKDETETVVSLPRTGAGTSRGGGSDLPSLLVAGGALVLASTGLIRRRSR